MQTGKSKSLARGSAYYLIYNVLNIAFPFLTGIYVAGKLLPANIGAVAAAQNLAQYFIILAFLGIPTYGLREIARAGKDREERILVFTELIIINLVTTCEFQCCYVMLVFSVAAYRAESELYLTVGISVALNALNISWLYEGMEEFRFISLRNLAFKALAFILLVLLVKEPGVYLLYALVTVIGTAGNCLINVLGAHK
ncbi:MAG: oligosaccharide flippase family protein, partial [Clostridia bacterium]|nr:oligosaccharide flippase family protein [Clostridia bacterium]